MPCNIVILGKRLDVDALEERIGLKGFHKTYKGEPIYKSKPNGPKTKYSILSAKAAGGGFDDLEHTIDIVMKFLRRHRKKLMVIRETKGVDYAFLDFGIRSRISEDHALHVDFFPNELLVLAGELGLGFHNSHYRF